MHELSRHPRGPCRLDAVVDRKETVARKIELKDECLSGSRAARRVGRLVQPASSLNECTACCNVQI